LPHLEAEHVCINITQSDHVGARGDAGDEWIVVEAETAQQVGDEFFIFKTLANGCKRIADAFDSSVGVVRASLIIYFTRALLWFMSWKRPSWCSIISMPF
jgi:hypothetical protein